MMVRVLAMLVVLTTSGCLPVLVGGLILKSSKSNAEKREFITRLQNTNMDRERLGLKPLDVCSEKYKFDPGWAAEDPVCLERIKLYQAGDHGALDMGTYLPRDSSPPAPVPPAANPPLDAAFPP
jgi:hypothetical protein